jgi:hypothetical protein
VTELLGERQSASDMCFDLLEKLNVCSLHMSLCRTPLEGENWVMRSRGGKRGANEVPKTMLSEPTVYQVGVHLLLGDEQPVEDCAALRVIDHLPRATADGLIKLRVSGTLLSSEPAG